MSTIRTAIITLLMSIAASTAHAETKMESQMRQAAEKAAQFTVPADIESRVNQTLQEVQAQAWQKRYQEMEKQVNTLVGLPAQAESDANISTDSADRSNRLYVFVSHSMPIETLRRYAQDLEKLPGGNMLLRGFVEGGHKMTPTAGFVANVLRRDALCDGADCALRRVEFYVDPVLFGRYRITHVPAFVYVENVQDVSHCSETASVLKARYTSPVLYGDASLRYIVDTLYKETKRPGLAQMAKALKKATMRKGARQ